MSLDTTQTVLLCAAAGFIIVWLGWPSKRPAEESFGSASEHSNSKFAGGDFKAQPEDNPECEAEPEEPVRPRLLHLREID